jgi:hypothetical protein
MATGRVPTTANSPLTAKGDLFGYSTTQARVAVGNNGETLVADSSTSTGLRYTAGTVQSNPVINSAMQVWQRGTSIAGVNGVNTYTADRWALYQAGASTQITVSRQLTNDTTNLPNIQYCARVQRNSGSTYTSAKYLFQSFETINSIPFAGKTVTLSYYARKGADFTDGSPAFNVTIATGTGTDQNWLTGYTGNATPVTSTPTLTTTWQRFTATGTIAATATELAVYVDNRGTGTAGANDWYEITGVQIDVGSVALPFRTYAATIQGELAACQRYYYLHASGVVPMGTGAYISSTRVDGAISFPVTMRTAPTLVQTSGTNYYKIVANNADDAFNDFILNLASTSNAVLYQTSNVSGTAGWAGILFANNASSSIAFNSEL